MNDRIRFLKISITSEFLILQLKIYSTQLLLKEKVFLKKSCFLLIAEILLHRLVLHDIL